MSRGKGRNVVAYDASQLEYLEHMSKTIMWRYGPTIVALLNTKNCLNEHFLFLMGTLCLPYLLLSILENSGNKYQSLY
jgi:hypothetical protein